MTERQLKKGNELKERMDNLTKQIDEIGRYETGWMNVGFRLGDSAATIPVPEDLKHIILDLLESNLSRKRWEAFHEFDAIGETEDE